MVADREPLSGETEVFFQMLDNRLVYQADLSEYITARCGESVSTIGHSIFIPPQPQELEPLRTA